MKFLFKTFEILIYLFLIILALLILSSALPIPGGVKTFAVKSGSMEPAIKTGGVVVVFPFKDYKVGDVITFGPNTKTQIPTTHRIIEESGSKGTEIYRTKGDNNEEPDTRQIRQKEVIGKVVLSAPYAGYAIAAAQKPIGFVLMVVVPAIIFIGDQLIKIFKEIKRMREEKKSKSVLGLNPVMLPNNINEKVGIKVPANKPPVAPTSKNSPKVNSRTL